MRTLLRRRTMLFLLLGVCLLSLPVATATSFATTLAPVLNRGQARPIKDRYIVVFQDATVATVRTTARAQAVAAGAAIHFDYTTVLNGFAATLPPRALDALRQNPSVAYIDQDGIAHGGDAAPAPAQLPRADVTQSNATWGIDRVDQRDLPLSTTYTYANTGAGVNAYILDSGIRASHTEFEGRVQGVHTTISDGNGTNDCHGHGTHVAGTIGGKTYGIAKKVNLKAVRILDCTNSGSWSAIIAGMDWTAQNHIKPAVANMSIQGDSTTSVDQAAERMIDAGVILVLIAGNFNRDACTNSPRAARAITLGASNATDRRWSSSNYGACVDLFAPGENVTSAGISSDTAVASGWSGTSMAAPHTTGTVAMYLQSNPQATMQQVHDMIVNNTTPNKLTNLGSGSPNRLLYTRFPMGDPGTVTPTPITSTPGTRTPTPITRTPTPITHTPTPITPTPLPGDRRYEAEQAYLFGGVAIGTSTPGYTGSGYATNFNSTSSGVEFTVSVPSSGRYAISMRYTAQWSATFSISVNNTRVQDTRLSAASSWSIKTETLTLNAGTNKIKYRNEYGYGTAPASIDHIVVTQYGAQ